jgi:hypothetical protein
MLVLIVVFLLFRLSSSFIEKCNQKYCINQIGTSSFAANLHLSFKMNSTDTGLIFPDSDFYAFLREYNLDASQLTKLGKIRFTKTDILYLGFGHNCNVIFDSQLLRSNPIQSLKSIEFDKICWLNSVHYGYCLEVPDEWKQRVQLINNRFCIPSRLDSVDEFPILYEELENHIELLNNSLNRALHLYTETEKANRQLQMYVFRF